MADGVVPTTQSMVDALAKHDHKAATDNKVNEGMHSTPVWGEKGQTLLLGPMDLKGVTCDTIFNECFASNSTFLKDYHEKRRDTNMELPAWNVNDRCTGVRMFSCTTLVDHPRADTPTEFNEAQRFVFFREGGVNKLLVQLSAQTPKVPFGTTFRVETWMAFVEDPPNNSVQCTMYGCTKKMHWSYSAIHGIAGPRAIRDMKAGYMIFMDMVSERLLHGQKVLSDAAAKEAAAPPPPPEPLPSSSSFDPSLIAVVLGVVVALASVFASLNSMSVLQSHLPQAAGNYAAAGRQPHKQYRAAEARRYDWLNPEPAAGPAGVQEPSGSGTAEVGASEASGDVSSDAANPPRSEASFSEPTPTSRSGPSTAALQATIRELRSTTGTLWYFVIIEFIAILAIVVYLACFAK